LWGFKLNIRPFYGQHVAHDVGDFLAFNNHYYSRKTLGFYRPSKARAKKSPICIGLSIKYFID
jgi:hypothetical protein